MIAMAMLAASTTLSDDTATSDTADRPRALRQPPQAVIVENDGVEYGCYQTGDNGPFQRLGHILIDYIDLYRYAEMMEKSNRSLRLELAFEGKRVDLWKIQGDNERRRGDYLKTMLDSETARLESREKAEKALTIIPWAIVVAESIVIFGLSAWVISENGGQ